MRLALIAALLSGPALAQPVVTSPRPDGVAVTVYADPARARGAMDLDWLGGFALITETRTIAVPAGRSTIRFEGVAGGILPVSAIVQGLPGGVIEKNRDRALLSPASLLDGSLGRHVVLRRTDPATGKLREEDAVIRSGSAGALVVQTRAGVEALRCSGLPETIVYDAVPAGLSATPTLSVETDSPAPATVTAKLSYLARDFDWSASYVVRVADDGRSLDLFAWATLANGNGESFADAHTQMVAGRINHEDDGEDSDDADAELSVGCWPMDTTSSQSVPPMALAPPPMVMAPAPVMAEMRAADAGSIVVTAHKAVQEELGDLKLYRIPEPVTVAAYAQKQVAMIDQAGVPFDRVYRFRAEDSGTTEPLAATILLRTRNKPEKHLGVPLPAGGVAVFQNGLLVAESQLRNIAVGEEVEIEAGISPQVRLTMNPDGRSAIVTNANRYPVTAEVKRDDRVVKVAVPANGQAKVRLPKAMAGDAS